MSLSCENLGCDRRCGHQVDGRPGPKCPVLYIARTERRLENEWMRHQETWDKHNGLRRDL